MSDDPATTFWPDSEVPSLYTVLEVPSTATPSELKRSYRRLSLLFHPDKLSSTSTSTSTSSTTTIEESTLKFQRIGFAYSILKDEVKRKRYDETGTTKESVEGAKTEAEWKDYFKDLWQGEVTHDSIEKFKKEYQGSEEEKNDLYDVYTSSRGDFEVILTSIMCSTIADEERFIELINEGIALGKLEETKKWKQTTKGDVGGKAKKERKKKADKEEKEAEKYAKELGVHEKLFGGGGDKKSSSTSSKKGKEKAGGGDDDDEAGLKALIQGNRDKRMNSLMDSLEAKYGGTKKKSKGGKRGGDDEDEEEDEDSKKKKGKKQRKVEEEPTEEEFARIQAEMDARRAAATNGSSSTKGKSKVKGGRKSK